MSNSKDLMSRRPKNPIIEGTNSSSNKRVAKSKTKVAVTIISSILALGAGVGIGYVIVTEGLIPNVNIVSDSSAKVLSIVDGAPVNNLLQKKSESDIEDVTESYTEKPAIFNDKDLFIVDGNKLNKKNVNNDYLKKTDTSYSNGSLFEVDSNTINTNNVRDKYLRKEKTEYGDGLFKATNNVLDNTVNVASQYITKPTSSFNNGDLFRVDAGNLTSTRVNSDYIKFKSDTYNIDALYKVNANHEIITSDVNADYIKKVSPANANKLFKSTGGTISTDDVSEKYLDKPTDFANGNLYVVNSDSLGNTNVNNKYLLKKDLVNYGANKLFRVDANGTIIPTDVSGEVIDRTNVGYGINGLLEVDGTGTIITTNVKDKYLLKTDGNKYNSGDLYEVDDTNTIITNNVRNKYLLQTDPNAYGRNGSLFEVDSNGKIITTNVKDNYLLKTDVVRDYTLNTVVANTHISNEQVDRDYMLKTDVANNYLKKSDPSYPAGALYKVNASNTIITSNVSDNYWKKNGTVREKDLFEVDSNGNLSTGRVNDNYLPKPTSSFDNGDLFRVDSGALTINRVNGEYLKKPQNYAIDELYLATNNNSPLLNVTNQYAKKRKTSYGNGLFKATNGLIDFTNDVSSEYTKNSSTTTPTTPTTNYADGLYEASGGSINPTAVTSQYISKPSVFNEDDLFVVENGVLTPTTPVAPTTRADGLYRVENGNITNTPVDGQYIRRFDPTNNLPGSLYLVNGVGNIDRADVRNDYIKKTDPSNANKLFKSTNNTISTTDVSNNYLLKTDVARDYLKKTDPSYPEFALFGVNSAHTISTQNLADQYIRKTNLRLYETGSLYAVDNNHTIITTNVRDQYLTKTEVATDYTKNTEIGYRVSLTYPSRIEEKTYTRGTADSQTGKIQFSYIHGNSLRSIYDNFYIYSSSVDSGLDKLKISSDGGYVNLGKNSLTSKTMYFVGESGQVFTIFSFRIIVNPTTNVVTTIINNVSIKNLWIKENRKSNDYDYSYLNVLNLYTASTIEFRSGQTDSTPGNQKLSNVTVQSGDNLNLPLEAHKVVVS